MVSSMILAPLSYNWLGFNNKLCLLLLVISLPNVKVINFLLLKISLFIFLVSEVCVIYWDYAS